MERWYEGVAFGENYGFGFSGEKYSEVWQRKLRLALASNQTKLSVSVILNGSVSVENWLLSGYSLKVATNCAILRNQKLWCGTGFLHKNKIPQACNLKHSIKKDMFSVWAKLTYLGRARWGILILLPILGSTSVFIKFSDFFFFSNFLVF